MTCHTHTQAFQLRLFGKQSKCHNPNTFAGLVGKVRKNYLPKEEGRVEKKAGALAGPEAQTRDLPRSRRGSPAARQGAV